MPDMTDADLAGWEALAAAWMEPGQTADPHREWWDTAVLVMDAIPALVAEVRRLRAAESGRELRR